MQVFRIAALTLVVSLVSLFSHQRCLAQAPDESVYRRSVVSNRGMPKDIVSPSAHWNFGPGSLWTHNDWQYAAFWDDQRQVTVARRRLREAQWESVSLPGYQRTKDQNRGEAGPKSRGFGDGHEKVSMGISPDGVIHLAFDHHVSPLHYRTSRGAIANDPDRYQWNADLFGPVQDHLGGDPIRGVTYPKFSSGSSRNDPRFALYLRLNGGSGAADSHVFEYAGGKWTIADPAGSKIIDQAWSGGDGSVNAYPHQMVMRSGRRHLTWCWRDTPDKRTCHDLCYAYSDDHGQTWLNNLGVPVGRRATDFMTADSDGLSVVPIPPGTRFCNGGSMTVGSTGRIHVLMRGENGGPAYFTRDPETAQWHRATAEVLGELVIGADQNLFVINEDGLWQTSANHFDKLTPMVIGQSQYFEDSRLGIDRTHPSPDGWISVIGQAGKTVTVIDYYVGRQ